MKLLRLAFAAFALVLTLALALGCSSLGRKLIETPKVELAKVDVRDTKADGATVVFGVRVENPNAFALKVDSLRYDVEIGGKNFSSGKIDKPAEVAAKDKTIVELPVAVRYADVFSSLLDLVKKGTSTYRLKGDASFGLLTVPFDEKGEFKLNQ